MKPHLSLGTLQSFGTSSILRILYTRQDLLYPLGLHLFLGTNLFHRNHLSLGTPYLTGLHISHEIPLTQGLHLSLGTLLSHGISLTHRKLIIFCNFTYSTCSTSNQRTLLIPWNFTNPSKRHSSRGISLCHGTSLSLGIQPILLNPTYPSGPVYPWRLHLFHEIRLTHMTPTIPRDHIIFWNFTHPRDPSYLMGPYSTKPPKPFNYFTYPSGGDIPKGTPNHRIPIFLRDSTYPTGSYLFQGSPPIHQDSSYPLGPLHPLGLHTIFKNPPFLPLGSPFIRWNITYPTASP